MGWSTELGKFLGRLVPVAATDINSNVCAAPYRGHFINRLLDSTKKRHRGRGQDWVNVYMDDLVEAQCFTPDKSTLWFFLCCSPR